MDTNTIKLFSSKQSDHWQTPPDFYAMLDNEFHFNHDPCPRHPTEDGLLVNWKERVFVNPPYSHVRQWLEKAHLEIHKESKVIVFLTFANTDTKWFHNLVLPYTKARHKYLRIIEPNAPLIELRFIEGRLKFISDNGIKNSAMRPSMLIIFREGRN